MALALRQVPGDKIGELTIFREPKLLERFGLPDPL